MTEPTKTFAIRLAPTMFMLSLALGLVLCAGDFGAPAQAQSSDRSTEVDPNVELAQAREKVKKAKKRYETIKRLSQQGSASQKALREARALENLAVLELADLVSPENEQQNSLLRAKIVFNYRSKELNVTKSLYERGSASQLAFQRAKIACDVAEAQLKAAKSDSQVQQKIQLIRAANSKFKLAQKEHQLAGKLLQSGSISQAVMAQAKSNLDTATSELAEAKKSLGAQATQIQQ